MIDLVGVDEYLPLRDVVFKSLRRAILKGELLPGERLMEVKLSKSLGVSRTPIREAMRKLELEGLVKMVPRKGATVAGITEKSLREVLEVRKVLEELAVFLACERMEDKDIKLLSEAEEKFRLVVKGGNPIDIAKADEGFHDIIFAGSGNDKLVQLLNNLREQMYRYRLEHVKDPKQWDIIIGEHDSLLQAIISRDSIKAKDIMRYHIDNQEKALSFVIK